MSATPGSPSVHSCDVVFVGGSQKALVAAALSARSGRSVAVLDRNDRPTGVFMSDGSTAVLDNGPSALYAEADRPMPGDGAELARTVDELAPVLGDLFSLAQALTSLISDFGGDVVTSAVHLDAAGREPAGPRSADNRVEVLS